MLLPKLILTKQEIADIRDALRHMPSLTHYANYWHKGYSVSAGFSKEQHEACKILNQHNIQSLVKNNAPHSVNLQMLEKELVLSEPLAEVIEVVLVNQWSFDELDRNLDFVKQKFKSKIEAEEKALERQMNGLKHKKLVELI